MSFFDHFAQANVTPIGRWIVRQAKQHQLRELTTVLPDRAAKILEIGPGRGELAQILLDAGYRNYTGVEPNPQMRHHLEQLGVQTHAYYAPNLDEEDNAYDAIIAENLFEHLNGTLEAQTFIREVGRVLRPGGYLFLAAPDYLHWGNDFFNCDYTHANITTVRRTIQILHNNNLRLIRWRYISGSFIGFLATLASYSAKVLGMFALSNGLDNKIYKLKLTFLRQFIVVAQKKNSS